MTDQPEQPPTPSPEPPAKQPGWIRRNPAWLVVGVVIVLAVVAVVIAVNVAGKSSGAPSAIHTTTPQPVVASSSPAVPPEDQQFVSDMQDTFNFKASVTPSSIAEFGQSMCGNLPDMASAVQDAQASWSNVSPGQGIKMATLADTDMCPGKALSQTVTYVTSGTSGASDVTYGPAGSDFTGSVPMSTARVLRSPSYYSISAQLQGGGNVSCQILVDGVQIATASAQGGFNIATCEIGQDGTGSWVDDNG
jgi:hypothetical protein